MIKPSAAAPVVRHRSRTASGAAPCVSINNQSIPWSFIQMVRTKHMGGDWDRTMDAFWKARHAAPPRGVMLYISKGLKPDAKGNRYSLLPSKERNEGQIEMIRRWWNGIYTPKGNTSTMKSALISVFKDLCKGVEDENT